MAKQLKFNEDARLSIKKGIDKLAQAVKMTLGPRGRAVIVEKLGFDGSKVPMVTFDGVTVAKEVELEDPWENVGAELVKQSADRTNEEVGDGTTTATVLSQAMIDRSEEIIRDKSINVIQLSDKLKLAGKEVIKRLEDQSEKINDLKKIEEVATLSAKDSEIGKLIATVMYQTGKDGVITIEDSPTMGNSFEIVEGMRLDKGYISPFFITNPDRGETVFEKPLILVSDKIIGGIKDIIKMIEASIAAYGNRPILIVAEDVQADALAMLIVNKMKGSFISAVVRSPGYGQNKKDSLRDIAALTGAHVFSDELGTKLEECSDVTFLGAAAKVIITKDHTTIVGGASDKGAVEKHVAFLRSQLKDAKSPYDKTKLEERIAKLSGGIAIIRVGAATESDQKEAKQRVEDAVGATKAAMDEGIVPGGGVALYNAYLAGPVSDDQNINQIINHALLSPLLAIMDNSGATDEDIKNMSTKPSVWHGYDGSSNKIVDFREAGIVDPLKVTKTALTNAISVAANYLMIGAAIIVKPEEKKDETRN